VDCLAGGARREMRKYRIYKYATRGIDCPFDNLLWLYTGGKGGQEILKTEKAKHTCADDHNSFLVLRRCHAGDDMCCELTVSISR
jgi:hypothetical protein